jgi:hypothetical protein
MLGPSKRSAKGCGSRWLWEWGENGIKKVGNSVKLFYQRKEEEEEE